MFAILLIVSVSVALIDIIKSPVTLDIFISLLLKAVEVISTPPIVMLIEVIPYPLLAVIVAE